PLVPHTPQSREQAVQCGYLLPDKRRVFIDDSDEQRGCFYNIRLLQTILQNRSARRVRELIPIDEVFLAVIEGVKRQKMQCAVRYDSDMRCSDSVDEGGHEFPVKVPKMKFGRFENQPRTGGHIVASQSGFLQLKCKPLLKSHHFGRRAEMADDAGIVSRNDEGQDLVSSREILNQRRSLREQGAKHVQRGDRNLLQRCILGIHAGHFAESARQFLLFERNALKIRQRCCGTGFGSRARVLNAELFAQLIDLRQKRLPSLPLNGRRVV